MTIRCALHVVVGVVVVSDDLWASRAGFAAILLPPATVTTHRAFRQALGDWRQSVNHSLSEMAGLVVVVDASVAEAWGCEAEYLSRCYWFDKR
jgi:hypothetical protein